MSDLETASGSPDPHHDPDDRVRVAFDDDEVDPVNEDHAHPDFPGSPVDDSEAPAHAAPEPSTDRDDAERARGDFDGDGTDPDDRGKANIDNPVPPPEES